MSKIDEEYLALAKEILETGNDKNTRAGETLSVFSKHFEFDLKEGFPILTTKKVFTRGFIHETLWFLHGDTNIKYLIENNVHIWDDDAYRFYCELVEKHNSILHKEHPHQMCHIHCSYRVSKKEFLEKVILQDKEVFIIDERALSDTCPKKKFEIQYTFGDLGPVYGKQWRHYGYSHKDQISELIHKLKKHPDDRRMICWAFNPDMVDMMALPPCHMGFEVYTRQLSLEERITWLNNNTDLNHENWKFVTHEKLDELNVPKRELSLCWMQRSCDIPLGWCGNIICYSLLLSMLAQVTNMTVGKVSCWLGDCHIYKNQIEGIEEQLKRDPNKFKLPQLILNKEITDIDKFTYEDIKIEGYNSYPTIKFPLSVG